MTLAEFNREWARQHGYEPYHPARLTLEDGRTFKTDTVRIVDGNVTRLDEPKVVETTKDLPFTAGKLRYS